MSRPATALAGLACCATLVSGCASTSDASRRTVAPQPTGVSSVRQASCEDWARGSEQHRQVTVAQLRRFAAGPVGSSAGIQNGPVLDDQRAYRTLQSWCKQRFARGFKLYKLYERAAAFLGYTAQG